MSWAGEADPNRLVCDCVSAVVGASVDGVGMVDTATSWELFNDAETHVGQRDSDCQGGDGEDVRKGRGGDKR